MMIRVRVEILDQYGIARQHRTAERFSVSIMIATLLLDSVPSILSAMQSRYMLVARADTDITKKERYILHGNEPLFESEATDGLAIGSETCSSSRSTLD